MICPYCESNERQILMQDCYGAWSVCPCGIDYREPMPVLEDYYQKVYRETHPIKQTDTYRAAWIVSNMGEPGTMLDIGCGTGFTLKLAADAGWKVEGVEPDNASREISRQYGKTYTEIGEVNKHYDWIVASHVIEHLPNAPEILKQLRNLANKFVLIVPIKSHGFPHVYAFGEKGFDRLVNWAGFTIERSGFTPKVHYWVICKGQP